MIMIVSLDVRSWFLTIALSIPLTTQLEDVGQKTEIDLHVKRSSKVAAITTPTNPF